MGAKTGIAWTDSTWNPIRGCSVVSPGCKNCYAQTMANRYSGPGLPYEGLVNSTGHWNGVIRVVDKAMDQPLRWHAARKIFVNSMSDLFHHNVSLFTIDEIFAVMAMAQHHYFQVLTKRPATMLKYLRNPKCADSIADLIIERWGEKYSHKGPFAKDASGDRLATSTAAGVAEGIRKGWRWPLPNVWLGVSAENQETADERIPILLQVPAAIRWVSYEPALGRIDFDRECVVPRDGERVVVRWLGGSYTGALPRARGLDWIVVGGESGGGARPFDIGWARDTVKACRHAGVACFVKQLGAKPYDLAASRYADHGEINQGTAEQAWVQTLSHTVRHRSGGDMNEWPVDLRVQAFPA